MTNRPLYTEFAPFYDALFGAVDTACVDFVCARTPPRGRMLDAGCGKGQYAEAFQGRGYAVVAIDRERAFLKSGTDTRAVSFVLGDLRWLPFRGCFDVALARGVLNDLIDHGDLVAALKSLRAVLRPGGLLIGDVRKVESQRRIIEEFPDVERRADEIVFRAHRTLTDDGVIVSSEKLFHDGRWTDPFEFRMRTFTEKDVRSLCRSAGLRVVRIGRSYGRNSRLEGRLVFVASRER